MDGLGVGGQSGRLDVEEKAAKVIQRQAVAKEDSVAEEVGVMLDRDLWVMVLLLKGIAGSSLAWNDLGASLCAGFKARETNRQHRVSTEGEAVQCNGVEWPFRSLRRRGWPGRMPREVVAKSGCCRSTGRIVLVRMAWQAWQQRKYCRVETVWAARGLSG